MILEFYPGKPSENYLRAIKDPANVKFLDPLGLLESHGNRNNFCQIDSTNFPANDQGIGRRIIINSLPLVQNRCQTIGMLYSQVYENFITQTHSICIELGELSTLIPRYFQSVNNYSLPPYYLDQYNMHSILNVYKPDLIIELGGGVSTVTLSYFASKNSAKHILLEESPEWAQNTFNGLRNASLPFPMHLTLATTEKSIEQNPISRINPIYENNQMYTDYNYNNADLLYHLENSNRVFVYIDSTPALISFRGAAFLMDEIVDKRLNKCVALIDDRPQAAQALSYHKEYKCLANTNTELNIDGLSNQGLFRSMSGAIFSKGVELPLIQTFSV